MAVCPQAEPAALGSFLRRLFLRLLCLMTGTATTREFQEPPAGVCEVLAFKYASTLQLLLSVVTSAAGRLYDDFIVEISYLMRTPQVHMALDQSVAEDVVLNHNNKAMLLTIIDMVQAAVPWDRFIGGLSETGTVGGRAAAMKTIN